MTEQAEHTGARGAGFARRAGVLLLLYVLVLAAVLFSPSSRAQTAAVVDVRNVLLPFLPHPWVTFLHVEVLLNVVLIAPLSFLGTAVWPRLRWQDWTAYAFLGATVVELTQGLLLPDRDASFSDIVANTVGALVGVAVYRLPRTVRVLRSAGDRYPRDRQEPENSMRSDDEERRTA